MVAVGSSIGVGVGAGSSVGAIVGSSVGTAVAVGSGVAVAVGSGVAVVVGSSVGVAVGSGVAVAVGSSATGSGVPDGPLASVGVIPRSTSLVGVTAVIPSDVVVIGDAMPSAVPVTGST